MSNLNTKLYHSVERSDGKRFELPIQGNSILQFGADGTPSLVPSVAAASVKGLDLLESYTITESEAINGVESLRVVGDQTARFVPGVKFTIVGGSEALNNNKVFEVAGSYYGEVDTDGNDVTDFGVAGSTTIVVKVSSDHPVVTDTTDGVIHIMDLLIKPPAGQVVRVSSAVLRTVTVSGTAANDGDFEVTAYTQSAAGNPADGTILADTTFAPGADATTNTLGVMASVAEILVTNDKPLYFLRNSLDTAATANTVDLLLDGQAI